jgi:hypothetical protein
MEPAVRIARIKFSHPFAQLSSFTLLLAFVAFNSFLTHNFMQRD